MACGKCGGNRKNQGTAATLRRSQAKPVMGLYETSSGTDCSGPYHGTSGWTNLFVVAIGTEQERMFTNAERAEAIKMVRDSDNTLTIDHLPVTSLCHEAVVAALGE